MNLGIGLDLNSCLMCDSSVVPAQGEEPGPAIRSDRSVAARPAAATRIAGSTPVLILRPNGHRHSRDRHLKTREAAGEGTPELIGWHTLPEVTADPREIAEQIGILGTGRKASAFTNAMEQSKGRFPSAAAILAEKLELDNAFRVEAALVLVAAMCQPMRGALEQAFEADAGKTLGEFVSIHLSATQKATEELMSGEKLAEELEG